MDIAFLLFLQSIREKSSGFLNTVFLEISDLAVGYSVVFIIAIIYWGISKKIGTLMLFADCLNYMVCGFVKSVCAVNRPWMRSSYIHAVPKALESASGYSFPSGHTTGAVSSYGVLSLFGAKIFRICMVLMVLSVMFSRMYLGVHTPQDVIVGALLSSCGIYVCLKILAYVDKNPEKDITIAGIIFFIQTVFLVGSYLMSLASNETSFIDPYKNFLSDFKYSAVLYGGISSWILERRFVNFSTDGTIRQRILRVLMCLFGLIFVIYLGRMFLKPICVYGKFLNYFTLVFYIVFIGPYLIKKSKI